MSSMEPDDSSPPNMFLPSMLRKNGGKFGETLGNALMNKFSAPKKTTQSECAQSEESPEPEVKPDDPKTSETSISESTTNKFGSRETLFQRSTPALRPVTTYSSKEPISMEVNKSMSKSTGNLSKVADNNINTLDHVERNELLKDVRSQRVKAPSTRPKSTHIFKEQLAAVNIPLDDDSYATPPSSPEAQPQPPCQPEEKKTTPTLFPSVSQSMFKIVNAQTQAEAVRRQYPLRSRAERPLSVGNVEAFRKLSSESPEKDKSQTNNEVEKPKERNKVLEKGLHHSKSTEILNTDFVSPKDCVTPTAATEKKTAGSSIDKSTIRSLKNVAVTLAKNVKSVEADIATIKAQLSNLITLIGEIEQGDKK